MSYDAVIEARKAAEAGQDRAVMREGIRLGLEMSRQRAAKKAAALRASMPAAFEPEQPVRVVGRETTDRGGVVRLEYWPGDGYVLWYHGRIVWKSWEHE